VVDPAFSLRDVQERTARRVEELMEVFDRIVQSSAAAGLDDAHNESGATQAFDRAQLSSIVDQARSQLAEINQVLDRLRRGSIGSS
jgi:DnaK suppressor protein